MPPCKWRVICGRDALEETGEDLCILHSHNPDKDRKAFDEAWKEHRKEKSDFKSFVFPREWNFGWAEFTERAEFYFAEFTGETSFHAAKFTEDAYFGGAKFTGEVSFQVAKFAGEARFSGGKFPERANFAAAEFTGRSRFGSAKFAGEADFTHAQFTGEADFTHAQFTGEAAFGDVKFTRRGDFRYAKFTAEASFEDAEFTEKADFRFAEFTKGADFRCARFSGRALFAPGHQFPQLFSGIEVDFTEVIIEPLDALTFRDTDLRKCRFLGTDLRKAEFANVTWPRKGGRFRVYDEDVELEESETRPWPHIENLYRQLKQNYEDRKDYKRASDFHYGEKEMRRRNPETHFGLRFLLTLYWLLSGYGERWIRPLIWAAGLLVVCAILYLFLGLHPKNGGPPLTWTSVGDWLEATLYIFRVMTLLKPDDIVPMGLAAKFLNAIQSILGPLLIGLLALAVRQRLKR